MHFFNPDAFVFLWAVPLLVILFWVSQGGWRHRLGRLGNFETLRSKLMPRYRPAEWRMRTFYLVMVFLFAALALARPQWGDEKKKIMRKGVDVIFHVASLFRYSASWEDLHAVNVVGAQNLCRAALAAGVSQLVLISSAGVYGVPSSLPVTEDDSPNPSNPFTPILIHELSGTL